MFLYVKNILSHTHVCTKNMIPEYLLLNIIKMIAKNNDDWQYTSPFQQSHIEQYNM